MTQSWHIRPATPQDADALGACMESAYAAYRDRLGGVRLPPMDADYAAEIDHYPTWVVESTGAICGGLVMAFEAHRAAIANIAVAPKWQGQGIGGALMRHAESTARAYGFTELQLATHVLLRENLALYRHLGWVETRCDETRVFMKKRL